MQTTNINTVLYTAQQNKYLNKSSFRCELGPLVDIICLRMELYLLINGQLYPQLKLQQNPTDLIFAQSHIFVTSDDFISSDFFSNLHYIKKEGEQFAFATQNNVFLLKSDQILNKIDNNGKFVCEIVCKRKYSQFFQFLTSIYANSDGKLYELEIDGSTILDKVIFNTVADMQIVDSLYFTNDGKQISMQMINHQTSVINNVPTNVNGRPQYSAMQYIVKNKIFYGTSYEIVPYENKSQVLRCNNMITEIGQYQIRYDELSPCILFCKNYSIIGFIDLQTVDDCPNLDNQCVIQVKRQLYAIDNGKLYYPSQNYSTKFNQQVNNLRVIQLFVFQDRTIQQIGERQNYFQMFGSSKSIIEFNSVTDVIQTGFGVLLLLSEDMAGVLDMTEIDPNQMFKECTKMRIARFFLPDGPNPQNFINNFLGSDYMERYTSMQNTFCQKNEVQTIIKQIETAEYCDADQIDNNIQLLIHKNTSIRVSLIRVRKITKKNQPNKIIKSLRQFMEV